MVINTREIIQTITTPTIKYPYTIILFSRAEFDDKFFIMDE